MFGSVAVCEERMGSGGGRECVLGGGGSVVSQWPEGNRDFPTVIDAKGILPCVVTFAHSLDTVLLVA